MSQPAPVRCFVAVVVEDADVVRRLGEARRLVPEDRGVKWVAPHQLHFTLKFLGGIEPGRLEAAARALREAAGGAAPFVLRLEGLGVFPPSGAARVVWAGCSEGRAGLESLAARVEAAFAAEGFPREERPFSPHLTIARVKDPSAGRHLSRSLPGGPAPAFGRVEVREAVLMRSDLAPSGPAYTPLVRTALSGFAAS